VSACITAEGGGVMLTSGRCNCRVKPQDAQVNDERLHDTTVGEKEMSTFLR
jgi:hypothetical protein